MVCVCVRVFVILSSIACDLAELAACCLEVLLVEVGYELPDLSKHHMPKVHHH
jgi:hypothetical protein